MLALLTLTAALAAPVDDAIAAGRGRPLAVVAVKGTWCGVCMDELARLSARGAGSQVVAVTSEPGPRAAAVARARALTLPLVSDPDAVWLAAHRFTTPNGVLPGVQFYDACGEPAGQIRGRSPAVPQTDAIIERLRQLEGQGDCQTPSST